MSSRSWTKTQISERLLPVFVWGDHSPTWESPSSWAKAQLSERLLPVFVWGQYSLTCKSSGSFWGHHSLTWESPSSWAKTQLSEGLLPVFVWVHHRFTWRLPSSSTGPHQYLCQSEDIIHNRRSLSLVYSLSVSYTLPTLWTGHQSWIKRLVCEEMRIKQGQINSEWQEKEKNPKEHIPPSPQPLPSSPHPPVDSLYDNCNLWETDMAHSL